MSSRTVAIALVCALALMGATRYAAAQSTLDGKKFDTEAGLIGKPAHVKQDILSFERGKFHSSDCDQYGYGKGDYKSTGQDGQTSFESETVSAEYGRNVWKGVIKGNSIEGTMVFYRIPKWWRPNPEPLEHWFKGPELR